MFSGYVDDKRGASALEFAILAPLLLFCMMCIIGLGLYVGAVHGVQQLVAEAARASIAGLDDAERQDIASRSIASNLSAYPYISPTRLKLEPVATNPATQAFTVTLVYDASTMLAFQLPFVPTPNPIITRSATIHRGGF